MKRFSAAAAVVAAGMILLSTPANAQIVALGASNTAGKGVGAGQAFPAQLQTMLRASGRAMTVRNAGISGNTTGQMLARLDRAVPKGTTIVILQAGGNDDDQAQRQSNINAILAKLSARGIRTVQADDHVGAALRSGYRQPNDRIHLTVEGHQQVARGLLSSM